jgi:molecular chaperone GrpE
MTTDPTKATEVVDAEDEVVDPATPEPAQEQAQAPELEPDELEPEAARAYDAAVEADDPADPADLVAAKAAKADEYLALAQRTQADFENYRKRATREAAAAQVRGVIKLAKELLPAVDDLDRALTAAEAVTDGAENPLVAGIKLVHDDMVRALERVGIESYSPAGEQFDPQHHEAVAQTPVDGAQPGTIVEVYQRGYTLGDSIIRPARVVVAG